MNVPRFVMAGGMVGFGFMAIAAVMGGSFGLSYLLGTVTFAALGVIVFVYVWERYAMLYDLPGRDKCEAVVDSKEAEARASSLLGSSMSLQLLGFRYAEGKCLWLGQSKRLWFACVVGTILFIFMGAAKALLDGKFAMESYILLGCGVIFVAIAFYVSSNRHTVHCLDFKAGLFIGADGSRLRLRDAWIEIRCVITEPGAKAHYELLLKWPDKLIELVLLLLEHESEAKKISKHVVKLTNAKFDARR